MVLSRYVKAIAALAGAGIGEAINEGLLSGDAQKWGHLAVVALAGLAVIFAPKNKD